jgi:hypothetical protein
MIRGRGTSLPWRTSAKRSPTASSAHAALESILNTVSVPVGGQGSSDFRTLQLDARHQCTRERAALSALRQGEYPLVERGAIEAFGFSLLQRTMNRIVTDVQPSPQGQDGQLGATRIIRVAIVRQERAVGVECHAGGNADGALESGVAAGVLG